MEDKGKYVPGFQCSKVVLNVHRYSYDIETLLKTKVGVRREARGMSLYGKESMDDSSGIDDRWGRIKDKR